MTVTKDTLVKDIITQYPGTIPVFLEYGIHDPLTPPVYYEFIWQACVIRNVEVDKFVAALNAAVQGRA